MFGFRQHDRLTTVTRTRFRATSASCRIDRDTATAPQHTAGNSRAIAAPSQPAADPALIARVQMHLLAHYFLTHSLSFPFMSEWTIPPFLLIYISGPLSRQLPQQLHKHMPF
ncbi:hypothetical protein Y032_0012g1600 [Ancylostoma ceylanicum]|nr:hypothetical protein Y032_0012g1600 [Ancylostoma ceylanicum]